MRYLSIPVSDAVYERFFAFQRTKKFRNQSECLEYVINKAVEVKRIEP